MRVSGILIALCLCFSAITAKKTLRDDDTTYSRPSEGASAVTYDGKIYITGGIRTEVVCATCPPAFDIVTSKLRIYDVASQSFSSALPAPMITDRQFHSSVIYDGTIVVFGGATDSKNNDLEQYDIAGDVWTVIKPFDDFYSWTPIGDRPSARWGHGAAVIDNHMYIYGGFDAVSGNALDDLWTFDFTTKSWKTWEVYGGSPNPRGGFSLTAAKYGGADVLLLFGGMDSSSKYYNELWMFNTNSYTWKHITPVNGPSPRAFHSAVVFEESQLVIFGGSSANGDVRGLLDYFNDVWTISIARPQFMRRWSQVKFEESNLNNFPAARHNHAASSWTDAGKNYFMVFSGSNEQPNTLADMWRCEIVVDPLDTGLDGDDVLAPEYGFGSNNVNISAARLYRFNRFHGEFLSRGCFLGYTGEECALDCIANKNCSGNGQCQFAGATGTCCCDEGFTGDYCEQQAFPGYSGFNPHELNKVLLPAAIELTISKIQQINSRLFNLQEILSSVKYSQLNMSEFASETHWFSSYCMDVWVNPQVQCFDEIVGCEGPCGEATKCISGDYCINGQCLGGEPVDCSHLSNGSNKCANAWCDEATGSCQVSTVNCDDEDPCTEDMCEPSTGVCVHHSLSACDDGSCCTYDFCDSSSGKASCYHVSKCEDYNPCTVDSCCETCSYGTCTYAWEDNCYLSVGQNTDLNPTDPGTPRDNGDAIVLEGENVVGGIKHATYTADAFFWLRSETCELIYDIKYDSDKVEDAGDYETGAFLYGAANKKENAGVIYTLPLGSRKTGIWSYCDDGVTLDTLRQGQVYAEIYFKSGAIRAQVEFLDSLVE